MSALPLNDPSVAGVRLSPQQRHLWQVAAAAGEGPFTVWAAIDVTGEVDGDRLAAALARVVERHEVLRTGYRRLPGMAFPLQVVGGARRAELVELPEAEAAAEAAGQPPALCHEAFDLAEGPVLRAVLGRCGAARSRLWLAQPALAADAAGLAALGGEVARAYADPAAAAEAGALQYADVAEWQNEVFEGDEHEAGSRVWRTPELAAAIAAAGALPGLRPRGPRFGPASVPVPLAAAARRGLPAAARRLGLPVEALALAALQAALARLAGSGDAVVGVASDGRGYEELQGALGLLSRHLPVAARVTAREPLAALAARAAAAVEEARRWQEFFSWDVVGDGGCDGVDAAFEWLPPGASWSSGGTGFSLARFGGCWDRFAVRLTGREIDGEVELALAWDRERWTRNEALRFARRLAALLAAAAAEPATAVGALPLAAAAELHLATVELNDTPALPAAGMVHDLFERQAERSPAAPALVCGAETLSYRQLAERAHGVAHLLRDAGVGADDVVALCVDRGADLVAALLGVLLAGAAYAPLDPALPRRRLIGMVRSSGARALLTQRTIADRLRPRTAMAAAGDDGAQSMARTLLVEDAVPSARRPPAAVDPAHLAYVIFTSGSTGEPKGVAVEHRQLAGYVAAVTARFGLAAGAGYASVTTLAADLGNTMVFPALCGGGCLHLVASELASDPVAFAEYGRLHQVDYLKAVPSHLAALIADPGAADLLPRGALVLGGEALPRELVARLHAIAPGCRVYNHYGPTEATVGVLVWPADEPAGASSLTVPLGRPLAGARVYLLDADLRPVPLGLAGELVVGGGCLARGYVGRPAATAERFVPDPLCAEPGGRLYRTGDLARLLPGGAVEFLGRRDDQVKIRGFRVEPGEVAAVLCSHPAMRQAVVVARGDGPGGELRLVGYVVLDLATAPSLAEIDAFLRERLPEAMVPAALVRLPELPLTANGKVDRRALPAPDAAAGRDGCGEPRTPTERLLAGVWCQVLGRERVGVDENFFELGGDSILSIQVIARANQAGLRLSPRQLFRHQTISELAAVAVQAPAAAPAEDSGPVAGGMPLTPIQHWFFDQELPAPHHFNQSLLLELRPGLDPGPLRRVWAHLVDHHDALRLRFARDESGWRQEHAPPGGEPPWAHVDFGGLPAARREAAAAGVAAAVQASLDLAAGPLLRVARMDLGGEAPPRLLIAVHHLGIDVVSWRVLLEDLAAAWERLAAGRPAALPPRTTSLRRWSERLAEHAAAPALAADLDGWLDVGRSERPLPVDVADGRNLVGSGRTVAVELSAERTDALLTQAGEAYRTRVDDLLVAALATALGGWTGRPDTLLDMEGHGREDVFEGVDLSRTVGWFTVRYPFSVDLAGRRRPGERLAAVKERLAAARRRALGFGLLAHLAPDPQVRRRLASLRPQVSFNYLGRLDAALPHGAPFAPCGAPRGEERAAVNPRRYLLEVNARVAGGRLQVAFVHGDRHRADTVEALAAAFHRELDSLLDHCLDPAAGGRTAADFPLAGLADADLRRLAGSGRHLEDVYPLSPLQEGLLFDTVSRPGEALYASPMSCRLEGDLQPAALRQAWQRVVDRHPMLRTSFAWQGLERPLQLVHRRVELPWEELDWRALPRPEQVARLAELAERQGRQGLDLRRAPVMSLTLARTGDRRWDFLWCRHHLLVDGWTTSLILDEVLRAYAALADGLAFPAEPAAPFRDYVAWLGERDLAAAGEHWRRELAGFTAPTALPAPPEAAAGAGGAEAAGEVRAALTAAETEALQVFARRYRVTLNTVLQGAWAIVLAHYADSDDVVFGGVVAGRPADLPGVETIVGPFLNTLPVRVRVEAQRSLAAWLQALQEAQAEQRRFEHSPLVEVQRWSQVPRGLPLFESILVFENYPMELTTGGGDGVAVRDIRHSIRNSYPLTLRPVPLETLELHVLFDGRRVGAAAAGALLDRLRLLLARFHQAPAASLGDLAGVLAAEDARRREERATAYDQALHQRFRSARRRAITTTNEEDAR